MQTENEYDRNLHWKRSLNQTGKQFARQIAGGTAISICLSPLKQSILVTNSSNGVQKGMAETPPNI